MYSVPIVPPDLRHEETIIQAINSLEYLNATIASVFDRIDARIDKNGAKIDELKSRISSAGNKINSLVGINKAIKIFSPAKFPASHVFRDIKQTFANVKEIDETVKLNTNYYISSSQDPIGHKNIQEKLVFYHVRHNKEKSGLYKILDQKQGLGCIPSNLKSVNSLLVYNTSENAYGAKNMDSMRKEVGREKQISLNGETAGRKIDAAPVSISHRQKGEKKINPELFYTPRLNDAPEINVPVDLPDLPGIADDVTFEFLESEKIAPSLYIEDLPDLPEPATIAISLSGKLSSDLVDESVAKKHSEVLLPPPPPPPQPPVPQQTIVKSASTAVSPAPPPPPPPPPMQPPVHETIKSTTQTKSLPNVTDARSNLMEAIRKVGGASGGKLRAAADVAKPNEPQTQSDKTKKTSGDLMADLHNKLSMRRKGISGAKGAEDVPGGGSVLNRLSALIPPPPVKPQANSSTTDASDEDDWAD